MADTLSILASVLPIDDASKRVVDVHSKHATHVNNARIELQTIIEDIHSVNRTSQEGFWTMDVGCYSYTTLQAGVDIISRGVFGSGMCS